MKILPGASWWTVMANYVLGLSPEEASGLQIVKRNLFHYKWQKMSTITLILTSKNYGKYLNISFNLVDESVVESCQTL